MYGYEQHTDIALEQILQKVDQRSIFEFVFKIPIDYNSKYSSPLRKDKNPGCRFSEREDGTMLFIDFGEKNLSGHTHRTCFNMVMDRYDTNMQGAIQIILQHFGLPFNVEDYIPIEKTNFISGGNNSDETELKYDKKPFPTRLDIGYWSQFLIRPEHLVEDNTFCVQRFSIKNQKKGYRVITPYKYCYVFDFYPKKKIYQPFNEQFKWITNCSENNIGNIDNLPPTGDELIIQKAYKDHRIIRNVIEGSNVIWLQNEGCIPDTFILKGLVDRFRLLTIFYDNDEAGILAAIKLHGELEKLRVECSRIVHMPFGEVKDIGEFMPREGRKDTLTILKHILYGL